VDTLRELTVDVVTRTVTVPLPLWGLVVLGVAWIGWAYGRAGRRTLAAEIGIAVAGHVEQIARLRTGPPVPYGPPVVGRARLAWPPLAVPELVAAGSDLPPRGAGLAATATLPAVAHDATLLAADHPSPGGADPDPEPEQSADPAVAEALAAIEQVGDDARVALAQTFDRSLPEPAGLDLSDAYDVFGTDEDEPEPAGPGPGDDDDPPAGARPPDTGAPPTGPPAAVELVDTRTFAAAVLPRYPWATRTGWDPLTGAIPPPQPTLPPGPYGHGWGWLGRAAVTLRAVWWTLAGRAVGMLPRPLLALVVLSGLWLLAPVRRRARALPAAVRRRAQSYRAGDERSWLDPESELSRRLAAERLAAERQAAGAGRQLRWQVAERTGATWTQQLRLMRAALRPPQRSVVPAYPWLGCAR
jgi:hypothetical protein